MSALVFRVCAWSYQTEPFRRRRSPQKPNPQSSGVAQLLIDACDLLVNLRGTGWDWSNGLTVPLETRDVTSKLSFILTTVQWSIGSTIAFDLFHYAVQWFSPDTFGSPVTGTIFDASLPPLVRYVRACVITILSGWVVYYAIESFYYTSSILGIVLFRQSPMQWPPISDKPYLSTSLNEFWAKRWHQLFRDSFIGFGGKPLMLVVGRVGAVIGVFFSSGILHDVGTWGMGNGTDVKCITGFFLMNGVGVLLEVLYKKMTGRMVGGFIGWLWTASWLLGWGVFLVDTWAQKGLIATQLFPDAWRPSHLLFPSLY